MGTRADFYVGRGEQSEWLGSIALDGYPDGVKDQLDFTTEAEERYRDQIAALLKADEYATTPNEGWPWPWETSDTTDYAYAGTIPSTAVPNWDILGEHEASDGGEQWLGPRTRRPSASSIGRPASGSFGMESPCWSRGV